MSFIFSLRRGFSLSPIILVSCVRVSRQSPPILGGGSPHPGEGSPFLWRTLKTTFPGCTQVLAPHRLPGLRRGQVYVFPTSHFRLAAKTIVDICKERRQIEIFFRWIKFQLCPNRKGICSITIQEEGLSLANMAAFDPLKGVAGIHNQAGVACDPSVIVGRVVRNQQDQIRLL
jgi:hypothetical protein